MRMLPLSRCFGFLGCLGFLCALGCAPRDPDSDIQRMQTGAPSNPETSPTDPLGLSGKTGRNLTLKIKNARTDSTKKAPSQICGIGLAGDEPLTEELAKTRMVCVPTQKMTEAGSSEAVELKLTDLPQPSYVTVFHDENLNRVLDFATLDLLIVKETGPAEGIGVLQRPEPREDLKLMLPLFLPVGETTMDVEMTYPDRPFWSAVKKQTWRIFHNYYVGLAHQLNNPKNKHSPTNIIQKKEEPEFH